jgi:hypothetical protein
MARDKILRVRLSDEEWERLETYAKAKDYTLTEVIRDYIKRLPRKKIKRDRYCLTFHWSLLKMIERERAFWQKIGDRLLPRLQKSSRNC